MSEAGTGSENLPPAPKIGLFEDNALPLQVSLKQQIACVERELKMRAVVYPREVAMGRKTLADAKSEIGQMQAVLRTLMQVQCGALPPGAAA